MKTIALSSDGKWMAVADTHVIEMWRRDEERPVARLRSYEINSLVLSPTAKRLASSDAHGVVSLWRLDSPPRAPWENVQEDGFFCEKWLTPDLGGGQSPIFKFLTDDILIIWQRPNTISLYHCKKDEFEKIGTYQYPHLICTSICGEFALFVCGDNTVALYSIKHKGWLKSFHAPWGVFAGAVTPDRCMLAGMNSNQVMLYTSGAFQEGKPTNTTIYSHRDSCRSIAFSGDGSMIASTSDDRQVRITSTKNLVVSSALTGRPSTKLVLDGTGETIMVSNDDGDRLLHTSNLTDVRKYKPSQESELVLQREVFRNTLAFCNRCKTSIVTNFLWGKDSHMMRCPRCSPRTAPVFVRKPLVLEKAFG